MPRILKPLRPRRVTWFSTYTPRFVLDEVGEGLELSPLYDVAVDDRHRAWGIPHRCRPERRRDGHGLEKCQRIVSRLRGIGYEGGVRRDAPPLFGRLLAGHRLLRRDTLDLRHDPVSDPAVREHGATVPEVLQSREYVGYLVDDAARPEQERHDDDAS